MLSGGLALAALVLLLCLLPAWLAVALGAVASWSLLATRSLHAETRRAEKALERGDLAGARHWLGRVVSRQTSDLEPEEIRRGLIETIAENLSDGVVAPLFWAVAAGLPGMALYKLVNTMDSMVGYRNQRYLLFGRAAARADDWANFLPARLTALLVVALCPALGMKAGRAWKAMARDHGKASSPNAGWPEAAAAGALGVRLGGPAVYFGRREDKPVINDQGDQPRRAHYSGAVRMLYAVSLAAAGLAVGGLAAAGAGWGGLAGLWW
jgi:adenosylcobinamide-phosphate synthase